MSAASVRTSGRRDNLPVFPIAAGKKGRFRLLLQAGLFKVLVKEFFQLVVHGELFLFTAFLPEPEQKPFRVFLPNPSKR